MTFRRASAAHRRCPAWESARNPARHHCYRRRLRLSQLNAQPQTHCHCSSTQHQYGLTTVTIIQRAQHAPHRSAFLAHAKLVCSRAASVSDGAALARDRSAMPSSKKSARRPSQTWAWGSTKRSPKQQRRARVTPLRRALLIHARLPVMRRLLRSGNIEWCCAARAETPSK